MNPRSFHRIPVVVSLFATACSWAVFSKPVTDAAEIRLPFGEIEGAALLEGMAGPESIASDTDGKTIYVTDCSGMIYAVNRAVTGKLQIARSKKIGEDYAIGIAEGPDGQLYAGVGGGDWLTDGGHIVRLSKDFAQQEPLTENFAGLNGMGFGPNGRLYFASSNMSHKHPRGAIHRLNINEKSTPETFITDLRAANGVKFHPQNHRLYFTETFTGVFSYDLSTKQQARILGKSEKFEFFDDICFDSKGRMWTTGATDFIKTTDDTGKSFKFYVEGIGKTSACMIREENGEEILYVTELKKPGNKVSSTVYDGRGIVSMPLSALSSRL